MHGAAQRVVFLPRFVGLLLLAVLLYTHDLGIFVTGTVTIHVLDD
jgi:hypothetical protein